MVFDLETPIVTHVANDISQKKEGYKFVADNSGEVVDFNVHLLADGANIAVDDHNGIVNGSHSFINKLKVEANIKKIMIVITAAKQEISKTCLTTQNNLQKTWEQINFSFSILTVVQKRDLHKLLIIKDLLKERLYLDHLQI